MSLTTLTAVATLAVCILGASGSVPEYSQALVDLQYAERTLFQLLPDRNNVTANKEKLGYLLLVAVVADISTQLAPACLISDYDNKTYYEAVDKAQKRVSLDPKKVLEEVTDEVDLADNKTLPVQQLVTKYCGYLGSRALPPCDLLIDDDVQKDQAKYAKPAAALLILGDLGNLWTDNTHEHENMLEYLLKKGLEELRPLIMKVAEGKRHLHNYYGLSKC